MQIADGLHPSAMNSFATGKQTLRCKKCREADSSMYKKWNEQIHVLYTKKPLTCRDESTHQFQYHKGYPKKRTIWMKKIKMITGCTKINHNLTKV
jgi:hypothetical protein